MALNKENNFCEKISTEIKNTFLRVYDAIKSREVQLLRQVEVLEQHYKSTDSYDNCFKEITVIFDNENDILKSISDFGRINLNGISCDSEIFKIEDYQKPEIDHLALYKYLEDNNTLNAVKVDKIITQLIDENSKEITAQEILSEVEETVSRINTLETLNSILECIEKCDPSLCLHVNNDRTKEASYQTKETSYQTKADSYQTKETSYQTKADSYQTKEASDQTKAASDRIKEPRDKTKEASYQTNADSYQTKEASYQTKVASYQTKEPSFQTKAASYQTKEASDQTKNDLTKELSDKTKEAGYRAEAASYQTKEAQDQTKYASDRTKETSDRTKESSDRTKEASDQRNEASDKIKEAGDRTKAASDQTKAAELSAAKNETKVIPNCDISSEVNINSEVLNNCGSVPNLNCKCDPSKTSITETKKDFLNKSAKNDDFANVSKMVEIMSLQQPVQIQQWMKEIISTTEIEPHANHMEHSHLETLRKD